MCCGGNGGIQHPDGTSLQNCFLQKSAAAEREKMKEIIAAVITGLLSGGAAAAIVQGINAAIVFRRERKAKKEDRAEEAAEKAHWQENIDVVRRLIELESEVAKISEGLKWELFDRIRYLGQKYIEAGEVDFDDLRLLNEMHEASHPLGLNGSLDGLMRSVNSLPLKRRDKGSAEAMKETLKSR